jgi:predicted nuclease of predicted toxin-antitoxin system
MTRFLVDANVNQKAIRKIPVEEKGFEILYPETGSYKSAVDSFVFDKAVAEERVLVTCDADFDRYQTDTERLRFGVIHINRGRYQKTVGELLERFCAFLTQQFPADPYNFTGKFFTISPEHIEMRSGDEVQIFPL